MESFQGWGRCVCVVCKMNVCVCEKCKCSVAATRCVCQREAVCVFWEGSGRGRVGSEIAHGVVCVGWKGAGSHVWKVCGRTGREMGR